MILFRYASLGIAMIVTLSSCQIRPSSERLASELYVAADYGYTALVTDLLNKGASLDWRGPGGETTLTIAAVRGHWGLVHQLVQSQINRSGTTDRSSLPLVLITGANGNTLLHLAVTQRLVNEIRFALSLGIPVDVKNSSGGSPLQLAVFQNDAQTAEFLIREKAKIEEINQYQETPLLVATWMGATSCFDLLLKNHAELKIRAHGGEAVAHYAAMRGHLDLLKKILSLDRTLLDTIDKKGSTPLMSAIASSQTEAVRLLVQSGANLKVKDLEGNTPADLAMKSGKPELNALLEMRSTKKAVSPTH